MAISPDQKIINLFFASPTKEFTLNSVFTKAATSKSNAHIIIEQFVKKNLVQKATLGRVWKLKANLDSEQFRRLKVAHNLQAIYQSALIEQIREKYPSARCIVLFGSYRKGDDVETSDLDIAVEIPGTKQMHIEEIKIINLFEHRKNVIIHVHIFSRHHVDLNVFSNIANGIVLDGFLEVKQ